MDAKTEVWGSVLVGGAVRIVGVACKNKEFFRRLVEFNKTVVCNVGWTLPGGICPRVWSVWVEDVRPDLETVSPHGWVAMVVRNIHVEGKTDLPQVIFA